MGANFTINSPFQAIAARCEEAQKQIVAQQKDIVQKIGVQTLSMAQRDYRTLSRRGTSSDGRKWKELEPETMRRKLKRGRKKASKAKNVAGQALAVGSVAIGIDTGLQVASGAPGFSATDGGNIFKAVGWRVTVGYGRSYSKYFDMLRKLLPDTLPDVWRKPLETTFGKWLQGIVSKATKGKP